jgi:alkylhydroperoxidase family enzyme
MPNVSYPNLDDLDPADREIVEYGRTHSTPRPESQAIRSHVPAVLHAFTQAWRTTFLDGVLDHSVKELCRVYVSQSIACEYWGVQRSVQAGQNGLTEADYEDLLLFEKSDRYTDREKTALRYTSAILWDASIADEKLWTELHAHFTEPEIVELGFFIALTSGQQRWIKTLGIGHQEVLGDTDVGLKAATK